MPSSHLNDPEHWRDRSKEARAVAEGMADPVFKQKMLDVAANYELCLPKIISGRNGGAAQTRLGWLQRPRSVTLPDLEAHPCPAPSACGPHCGTPRKKKESVAGAPRQRPASSQALPTHGANQTFHIR